MKKIASLVLPPHDQNNEAQAIECPREFEELHSKLKHKMGLKGTINSLKWPLKEVECPHESICIKGPRKEAIETRCEM